MALHENSMARQNANAPEDLMVRDPNPGFRQNVEDSVMDSLRLKSDAESNGKLINWRIYNAGQQTIIVL